MSDFLRENCDQIKTIVVKTKGTPTQKLLAILQACGISSTAELARVCGLTERAVHKAIEGMRGEPRPWFKFFNSVVNDNTVQQLAPPVFKSWVNLQCVAAQYPNSHINDADMAWRLRLTIEEWREHKVALIAANLITDDNRSIYEPLDGIIDRLPPAEWNELRKRIFERDGHACQYCGSTERLECDHVIPISRGGTNADDNLVTACRPCNRTKRDRIVSIEEFSAKRRAAR